ncbi:MAG: hypothetical protein PHI79_08365 [Sulfurovaceae bacterium]|nr:hypothetical protein [Sulfurovaceae bacterium]
MKKFILFSLLISSFVFASDAYTPPKGSLERASIMNALRVEVKKYHNIDVIFKVQYLRVKDGWAWADTMPMSKDGKNNYEDVIAILHKKKGVWSVAELVCTEVETEGCIDDPEYFQKLNKKFPDIPTEIIPVIASPVY